MLRGLIIENFEPIIHGSEVDRIVISDYIITDTANEDFNQLVCQDVHTICR